MAANSFPLVVGSRGSFSLQCTGFSLGWLPLSPCLETSIDRVAWQATVCLVTELDTTERLTLSLSVDTEPCATAAVDLQHPLREFRVA